MKNICVGKSFYFLGNNLDKCFKCSYCRIQEEKVNKTIYNILPTIVNSKFSNIPVAVNLFYGDPLLQIDNTINILRELEKANHKGAVLIITKGDYSKFPDLKFNLDLHFAFSTFGLDHEYDGNTWIRFINNLEEIKNRKFQYKYSIEFRPICYGINDSYEVLEKVIKTANKYNLSLGYSGLQGKPETIKYWKDNNINLIPYPNYTFGHLKPLSNEVEDSIRKLAKEYNVNVFHKTSCLISYVHNYDRDYNCHYYRPDEVRCDLCKLNDKCKNYKENLINEDVLKELIPFDFTLEYKTKHECSLMKMNLCKYPTINCSNISGYVIKIDKQLTAGDYRMIKWLTGYLPDNKFNSDEILSDEWYK